MPTTDWNTRNDKGNKARNISGYKPWNCRNWQVHLMLYQPVRIVCLLWISGSMKLPKKYQQLWCKRRRSKPWFYDWYFCRQRKREGLWNSSADNSANRLYWAHEMIHHFTAQPCYTMPSPKWIRDSHLSGNGLTCRYSEGNTCSRRPLRNTRTPGLPGIPATCRNRARHIIPSANYEVFCKLPTS